MIYCFLVTENTILGKGCRKSCLEKEFASELQKCSKYLDSLYVLGLVRWADSKRISEEIGDEMEPRVESHLLSLNVVRQSAILAEPSNLRVWGGKQRR